MALPRTGTLPPAHPPADISPNPNFQAVCSRVVLDTSLACESAALQAIDAAREQEGLPTMVLPSDWWFLSPQQQLFVATNLERTIRGLPPLTAMATLPDQAAATGAATASDPTPLAGFPYSVWASNWAAAVGSPLAVVYLWMYDDGPGSGNLGCPSAGASGCWGHRDNILLNLACRPCLMGTGFDATGWNRQPAWAQVLADSSGSPALDFNWTDVTPYLPGDWGSRLAAPAVGMAATPDGNGYWLVSADGGVFSFGDAGFHGSMGGQRLNKPIVGMARTADGKGYWLVASDGGLFSFGDAGFAGSMGGRYLARPIVGMASTADARGYWMVASDGGLFSFGDARFYGSMGGRPLNRPMVGMAVHCPSGGACGYWLVASDGGLFAFGSAPFYGSTGRMTLQQPVVAMSASPDGRGYWLTAADGGIFAYGDAPFRGSTGGSHLIAPVVAIANGCPSGGVCGYWLLGADGGIFSFGLPFHGSMG
jgi:hypothetical protein